MSKKLTFLSLYHNITHKNVNLLHLSELDKFTSQKNNLEQKMQHSLRNLGNSCSQIMPLESS